MPTNSPKFQYPGIVPFPIEFEKTIEEIENSVSIGKTKIGTLYPLGMSLENIVKFYWRVKKINFNWDINYYVKEKVNSICTTTNTIRSYPQNSYFYLTEDTQTGWPPPEWELTDALESLKQRVCKNYSLLTIGGYTITGNQNNTTMRNSIIIMGNKVSQFYSSAPRIIAKYNSGDVNDPNSYLYYPLLVIGNLMQLIGSCYTFLTYDPTQMSVFTSSKTCNVLIDGQNIGSLRFHFLRSKTYDNSACTHTMDSTFSDFSIELWQKPV